MVCSGGRREDVEVRLKTLFLLLLLLLTMIMMSVMTSAIRDVIVNQLRRTRTSRLTIKIITFHYTATVSTYKTYRCFHLSELPSRMIVAALQQSCQIHTRDDIVRDMCQY